jgi:hypothetical protein
MLPMALFDLILSALSASKSIKGIKIIISPSRNPTNTLPLLRKALELISDTDQIWFTRLRREIRYIIDTPNIGIGAYSRPLRVCRVDLQTFSELAATDAPKFLAGVLIHEITHAHLLSKGFGFPSSMKIEAACLRQTFKFGRKIGLQPKDWDAFNKSLHR